MVYLLLVRHYIKVSDNLQRIIGLSSVGFSFNYSMPSGCCIFMLTTFHLPFKWLFYPSLGLNLRNNLINLVTQHLFPRHDALDFCVQLGNVDDLAGVLLLHIGGYRQVIILFRNLVVIHKTAEIVLILAVNERCHNFCNVVLGQFVIVRDLDKFFRGINKQRLVLCLALFSTIMQVAMLVPKNRFPGS